MRTLRLRPESAGAWRSPPGRGVCTFPRVIRSPSPWRPGRPDTSACPRASGLWLGFRGARPGGGGGGRDLSLDLAAQCSLPRKHRSAPPAVCGVYGSSLAAGGPCPAFGHRRAFPLCVLGIRQRKRWLQLCLTWTALSALVNLAPPHDVKSCALVLGIRGGEDA